MKHIIIFTESNPITDGAMGIRAFNLARMISESGYKVTVLGLNYNLEKKTCGEHLGIPYELITFPEIKFIRLKKYQRIRAMQNNICQRISEIMQKDDVYAVITNNVFSKLQKMLREKGCFLIKDDLEFFSTNNFSKPFVLAQYMRYRFEKERNRRSVKNIIAISTFLKTWNEEKGANVVRITTLTDTALYPTKMIAEKKDQLRIFYAGNIGRKDETVNVIKAIALLSEDEKKRIIFDIYGIDEDMLLKRYDLDDNDKALLGSQVICHGSVPHSEIMDKVLEADFTVLLRKDNRKTKAGFPTKLGESMSCGVPVIGNITSDIGMYFNDGIEGLLCKNETPEECAIVLRRALGLSLQQLNDMRINARKQAEKSFDYRNYTQTMRNYLKDLKM